MTRTADPTHATATPTGRSGTPQATLIGTLIMGAAVVRAHWAAIGEEYDHLVAILEGRLIEQMPTKYTTDVVQRAWLDSQLHQNQELEALSQQRLAAYREFCASQAEVDANRVVLEERKVAAFDGTGSSVFAVLGRGLHTHGVTGGSPMSPMDKPDSIAGDDFRAGR